jgi:hypothetical protein
MLVDKFAALIKSLIGLDSALANVVTANNDNIHLIDNTLVFTIRGIYPLVCNADDMTYIEFRTGLYQGNLNQELGKLGYEVVISDSTGNIDTSWYQLRPLEVV